MSITLAFKYNMKNKIIFIKLLFSFIYLLNFLICIKKLQNLLWDKEINYSASVPAIP